MLDNINKKTVVDKNKREWLCLRNITRNDIFTASFGVNYLNSIIAPNNIFFAFQQKNTISRGYIEKELYSNNKLFFSIEEAVTCDDFIENREPGFVRPLVTNFFNDRQFTNSLEQKFGNKLDVKNEYDKKLVEADSILIEHTNKLDSIYDSIIKHTRYDDFFYAQGPLNLHLNFDDDKEGRLEQMLKDFERSGYYNSRKKNPSSMEYLRKMSCYMNVGFFENKYLSGDEPPSQDKINFWLAVNSFLNEDQKDYLSQIMNAQDQELNDDQKNLRTKILNDKDFQNKIIDSWKKNFGKIPRPEDEEAIKNGTFKINKQQLSFIMHAPENELNEQQKMFKDKFLSLAHDKKIEELRQMMDKSEPDLNKLKSLKEIMNMLEPENRTQIKSCIKIIGDDIEDEPIKNISVREKNMPLELKNEITSCLFANEEKYLDFNNWSQEHKKEKVNELSEISDKCTGIEKDIFKFIIDCGSANVNDLIDQKLESYGDKKDEVLKNLYKVPALPKSIRHHLIEKYPIKNQWLGMRDMILNKVYGAAGMCYNDGTNSMQSFSHNAMHLNNISHELVETELCMNNNVISLEEAIDACAGADHKPEYLAGVIATICVPEAPLNLKIKNVLIDMFGDDYTSKIYENKLTRKERQRLKSILKQYVHYFDEVKNSVCRHASYNTFFYTQGTTTLHLNFDKDKNLDIMLKDFDRSSFYNGRKNNPKSMDYLRLSSCYMTASFFENKYLTSNTPPSKETINFWVAVNSYLNEDQRNYLSQIMNAKDNELTAEQKNLRDKILNDAEFIKNIINEWKNNFEKIPDDIETFEISKQQLYFIMHAEESELNEQQKQFKNKFLGEVENGNEENVKKMIADSEPKNIANISLITNILVSEKRKLIPSCVKVIQDNLKTETVTKNVSVSEKDMPEILKNEINNCIFANEEKYLKFDEYSDDHKKNLSNITDITKSKFQNYLEQGNGFLKAVANGKLNSCFTEEKNKKAMFQAIDAKLQSYEEGKRDKILGKFLSNKNLSPVIKDHLFQNYQLEKVNGFTKSLARGEIEFSQKTAEAFLKRFYDKYKNDQPKGTKLLNKIYNDKKTTLKFKDFISKSFRYNNQFQIISSANLFNAITAQENKSKDLDTVLCEIAREYYVDETVSNNRVKGNEKKDKGIETNKNKNKNDSQTL